ncbi:MAG TPA: TonB-dependent receptor [Gemmatimonadales bacterium]|jgi:outer membrane receptor protein involved in Fe transport|nr:TonB-dependent receptor [Gemmatimonadales bacterium]
MDRIIRWRGITLAAIGTLAGVGSLRAQEPAVVQGVVRAAESGEPLAGARVFVEGSDRFAVTDAAGRFRLVGVAPGEVTVVAQVVGRAASRRVVTLAAADTATMDLRLERLPVMLDEVVVTALREAQARADVPATVGTISGEALRARRPQHPSDVMNQVPGVWVNTTGGEGHMAAIRQPLTTNAVYLYLEDGVPSRSTGFFNHNALYEINLPQAGGVEVLKGPPPALYGSDAIGGVVNVATRAPAAAAQMDVTAEAGSYGWGRLLLSGSLPVAAGGVRADLNLTRTDGWRDATGYDRESATLRWDRSFGANARVKTVVAWSRIDQQTAGSSTLPDSVYESDPTQNFTPISYRRVGALRVSAAYERWSPRAHLAVTPFVRVNSMDMLPNWTLAFDPLVQDTRNSSFGLLATYRRDFTPLAARIVTGVDVDVSPGERFEQRIVPSREGPVYADYTPADTLYDYDVTFRGISPYAHLEGTLLPGLRASAGVRVDVVGYRYDNRLSVVDTGSHRRPGDATVDFEHVSPKLGLTWAIGGPWSAFASWRDAFRAPSEGQLFRQGRAVNTLALQPVTAQSGEVGVRGAVASRVSFEVSVYDMRVDDDILSYTHPDGTRETVNAGRTRHRGLEAGVGVALPAALRLDFAGSWAKHEYVAWQPTATVDLSGKEMESAPRALLRAQLSWTPPLLRGGLFSVEWSRVGEYWMDQANTERYAGHDLWAARLTAGLTGGLQLRAAVSNLGDVRYAETASYAVAQGRQLAPGMPRTLSLGVAYGWAR